MTPLVSAFCAFDHRLAADIGLNLRDVVVAGVSGERLRHREPECLRLAGPAAPVHGHIERVAVGGESEGLGNRHPVFGPPAEGDRGFRAGRASIQCDLVGRVGSVVQRHIVEVRIAAPDHEAERKTATRRRFHHLIRRAVGLRGLAELPELEALQARTAAGEDRFIEVRADVDGALRSLRARHPDTRPRHRHRRHSEWRNDRVGTRARGSGLWGRVRNGLALRRRIEPLQYELLIGDDQPQREDDRDQNPGFQAALSFLRSPKSLTIRPVASRRRERDRSRDRPSDGI